MAKMIMTMIGLILLSAALIGALTPIPLGIVFLVPALLILIPASPLAASMIRDMRRRSNHLDRSLVQVSRRLPDSYRRILSQTEIGELDRGPLQI